MHRLSPSRTRAAAAVGAATALIALAAAGGAAGDRQLRGRPADLQATENRRLQNQADIAAAIRP